MRQLGREFVESERGEQADGAMGHCSAGFRKAMRLGPFRIGKLIETAPHAHQKPLILQSPQIGTGNAPCIEIAGARDAAFPGDCQRAILQRSLGRFSHVP